MSKIKTIAAVLILVLLAAAAATVVLGKSQTIEVEADFERVTGLYSGSGVRMLGVEIGSVKDIEPMGEFVRVKMEYDGQYRVPADATAAIIPPSLIADRYVQFTPAYRGGPVMKDKTKIPRNRTMVPVELSTVLKSVDDLSVALGPEGANKDGALSKLVSVSANNLRGNGEQINSTVRDVSTLLTTLSNNKDDLVGTINNLDQFTHALRNSDGAVRSLTRDLAIVSGQLSDDRQNLASAVRQLGVALGDVTQLVRENRQTLVADIRGLTQVTGTLLKQQKALSEILDLAPTALQNLDGSFDPESKSLRTKNNFQQVQNPQLFVCQILSSFAQGQDLCANPIVGEIIEPLIPGTSGQTGQGQ